MLCFVFYFWRMKMSSVFKSPKVVKVEQPEVEPETVDVPELTYDLEKRRKKKMGAVSQLLSHENSYDILGGNGKKTLGG